MPRNAAEKDANQGLESNLDLESKINVLHQELTDILMAEQMPTTAIPDGTIRLPSVLYMLYWFGRLKNNSQEQARIRENLIQYIGSTVTNVSDVVGTLLANTELLEGSREYAENLLVPTKTIDLVIVKIDYNGDKSILSTERNYYPFGLALPGGIIKDEDEDNELNLPAQIFAALRVAGEKVLGLSEAIIYEHDTDEKGHPYFLVRGEHEFPRVRIHTENDSGYVYRENIKSVLRPSDPRHIVDTIGFACELEGEPADGLTWVPLKNLMSIDLPTGGMAFGHHREIIAHITAKTSLEKEREMQEHTFIRTLIKEPLKAYLSIKASFEANGNSPETPFPELFPIVDRLLSDAFSEDINKLCEDIPLLAGVRDKMVISLRHVSLKNRTFCPYLPTLHAIAQGIAFFDVVARQKKGFYNTMIKDRIIEHDPKNTAYASYHMYRYKYRYDQLLGMVPGEILIPTYETLSVTDLMRVRAVPIRFIGLSEEFLYVDEFEQSPEEFFMHDCNHSWRMIMEDKATEKQYGKTKQELISESDAFIHSYLEQLRIRVSDSEEEREIKKLKKIILFEIVHEDAKPFLKELICKQIQIKEGNPVPFEVPHIDPATGYVDVVDTLDTGISTLSYVRNKLQHGFYDHIDAQMPQLVDPKYRKAEWIARAAQEMLRELEATPSEYAEIQEDGQVSYEWLLRRTCAVGPDNIHGTEHIDPTVEIYGDGAEKLNPKRYQTGI